MIGGSSPGRVWEFFLHHRVQTGSGAHPASNPKVMIGSFPGGKSDGAWSWPLISIRCRGQECVELCPTPQYAFMSWCSIKARGQLYLYLLPVSKRETQREQNFRCPKISIIFWTVWCPTPSCAVVSLTVFLWFSLMLSVAVVLCRPRLTGDVRVSILKSFHSPDTAGTHADTHTHTHHEVARRWLLPSFTLLQGIQ
jgi:hypothetical protein